MAETQPVRANNSSSPKDAPQNWQDILWREWYHCHDQDYARRLYQAVPHGLLSWFRRLGLRRLSRPHAAEVEAALRQACVVRRGARDVWQRRLERLDESKEKPISLEKWVANLQDHHWLERFVARHVLLDRGGEAVDSLRALTLNSSELDQAEAVWLLQSIAADTTARLAQAADTLLCLRCLVYCGAHPIDLPWQSDLTFYGCRLCQQSRDLQPRPDLLIAVLDQNMAVERKSENQTLRVNWLQRRSLFDFDRVEIVQASDEEVERFAVLVGNDTDPVREPRYRGMICKIGPECQLSKNTMRILEHTFGEVIPHAPHL